MTRPGTSAQDAERRAFEVRETARRETFRLARDAGAQIVTRPMFRGEREPTVSDVEPLAGAAAARDLELASRSQARDYIRLAREAGHGWDQIGRALGLEPGPGQPGAMAAGAAHAYAAGGRESDPPWEPRYFSWTCRSCDQHISDRGLVNGPAGDQPGHAEDCPRLDSAITEWNAQADQWAADWEAGK